VWGELSSITTEHKPDRKHGYCIDYVASPTTDENIFVRKNSNYLLKLVSTDAMDQSTFIIKALINTFFTGLSSSEGYRSAENPETVSSFDLEYDPFDPVLSAVVNDTLSPLGLCLILENQTFDPTTETINSYCSNPKRVIARQKQFLEALRLNEEKPVSQSRNLGGKGIFYRPRLPYNYYLFVKVRGKPGWKLRETAALQLENVAPIINVGVDRTFFAERHTSLVFDDGALSNVCVYKSSELVNISSIPLTIANDVAALPANVVQMRIDQANNYKALATAQDQLITTQQNHLKFLQGQGSPPTYSSSDKQSASMTALSFEAVGTAPTGQYQFGSNTTACPSGDTTARTAVSSTILGKLGSVGP
jgi:hypothetical protein